MLADEAKYAFRDELGEKGVESALAKAGDERSPRKEPPVGEERSRETQGTRQLVADPVHEQQRALATAGDVGEAARFVALETGRASQPTTKRAGGERAP
jgi:hypothetical protein